MIEFLGFDWKFGVGLILGIGVKELVVSILGVFYMNESDIENVNFLNCIFIILFVVLIYMLFVLIYFLCIVILIVIK